MSIRHPNRESTVIVRLYGDHLSVSLDYTYDNLDGRRRERFAIGSVRLTYFPGIREAQEWLTAAWCGYLQHEALELVTVDDVRVFDPHDDDYPHGPWNWTLCDGMPRELTPETLAKAMKVLRR